MNLPDDQTYLDAWDTVGKQSTIDIRPFMRLMFLVLLDIRKLVSKHPPQVKKG